MLLMLDTTNNYIIVRQKNLQSFMQFLIIFFWGVAGGRGGGGVKVMGLLNTWVYDVNYAPQIKQFLLQDTMISVENLVFVYFEART